MSELHFDADGEPAKVPADAEELRVRRFRKPGERGACEVVHGADGAPLYAPVDATYLEFRKLVAGVPGRYRLDPVDATRKVISSGVPLYVTIEAARNGGGGGDERDSLMRELVRANVEMMRANVEMTKQVTDRLSYIMTASADVMRAADGAGLPRREPLSPAPAPDDDDDDDDEEEEDEDEEEGGAAGPLESVIADLIERAAPHLVARMSKVMPPAAPAEPAPVVAPAVAAAPAPSAVPAPVAAPAPAATPAPAAPAAVPAPAVAPSTAADAASPRNASAPTPTAAQLQHLCAIDAQLAPDESKIVRHAIKRLSPEQQAQWLEVLSTMTVDDAVKLVRAEMPPLRTGTRKEREP